MSTEPCLPTPESGSRKRVALRPWFVAIVLGIAAFYGWLFWPGQPGTSPLELSRADGKTRFYATTYSKTEVPLNLSLRERLFWAWREYQRRHGKRNPAAYSFPAASVRLCSI